MPKNPTPAGAPDPEGPQTAADLAAAPLEALLAYGLTLAGGDLLEGILVAARADLLVVARLAEAVPLVAQANALTGVRRRLDVAIEIRRRELQQVPPPVTEAPAKRAARR